MTPLVLAIALMVPPLPLAVGPNVSSTEAPRQVALEIDHAGLLEHQEASAAEETASFVRQDGEAALRNDHRAEVVQDADAPAIVVRLGWTDYAASIYRIELLTQRPGHDARMLEALDCPCIDSDVIAAVLERLPAALEQLDEPLPTPQPAPSPEPEAAPDPADGTQTQTETEPELTSQSPIGLVGMAGIVVAAGGIGALGFGISRLAMGQERTADPDTEEQDLLLDARPQGRAWLGIGLGGVAVGATMLVLDLTVLRRRRARLSVAPTMGAGLTGLHLQGRF